MAAAYGVGGMVDEQQRQWVVSVEVAGASVGRPQDHNAERLAALQQAFVGVSAAVEAREDGYGVTILLDCDDAQAALAAGLAALRTAEDSAGLLPLPMVAAEVTAAGEVEGVTVPARFDWLDHLPR